MAQPFKLEFPYRRSVGPIVGAFLTGLRDARILGGRTSDGRVLVPPLEYEPETGEAIGELVPVEPVGTVTGWTWNPEPDADQPLERPFAWALVKLDGADTPMLHAVDAGAPENMETGMRVRARWRLERKGHVTDLECFEPEDSKLEETS